MITFACHLLGLSVPGIWLGHRLRLPLFWAICASFLIFETSLVLGAGLLSPIALLGDQLVYQATTILIAFGLAMGFCLIARHDIDPMKSQSALGPAASRVGSSITFIAIALVSSALLFWFALDILQARAVDVASLKAYKIITMPLSAGIAGCTAFLVWSSLGFSTKDRRFAGSNNLLKYEPLVVAGSIVTLAIFAALMLWLALNAYPAVEDSLTIKLPKVVFALESGSILPSKLTDDGRMYISPVYPTILQLFFIINGQKSHALLAFGFANWVMCGAAIYAICRHIGASLLSSWVTLTIVLLSPTLIIQGTSEGDDILAATPLLLSLLFLTTWARSNRKLDAVLAGLGLGLSTGIKLFPLLYLPAIPIVLLLALRKYKISSLLEITRSRIAGALLVITGFTIALLPHTISNWIAFGNPLYVSPSVQVTRNSPFSLECALRDTTGYLKQFLFSDLLKLLARALISPFAATYETYVSNVDKFNKLFSTAVPFDPTPACSAWDAFIVTSWYPNDNTFWYGIFGPVLFLSCIAVAVSRKQPLLARSLSIGFIVWLITFAFTQKYIAWIGRYWSLPVLAASPVVAVCLDKLIRRCPKFGRLLGCASGVAITVSLGIAVLTMNYHRSLAQAFRDGPRDRFFPAELRSVLHNATSTNIQVIYGMNTYDYYLMLAPDAQLLNKNSVLEDSLNFALVRPYGVSNNPFSDTRIAIRMRKPFAHGFKYYGQVPMGFGFVNNVEIVERKGTDPKSEFLLFQASVKQEGNAYIGSIIQIADSTVANSIQYRIGWRDGGGTTVVNGEWQRGPSAIFKIPADAAALIVQAAFIDATDDISAMEWPMGGYNTDIMAKLK